MDGCFMKYKNNIYYLVVSSSLSPYKHVYISVVWSFSVWSDLQKVLCCAEVATLPKPNATTTTEKSENILRLPRNV